MDLERYADGLREQLAVAAEAGGDEARSLAERLTAPLDAAVRLMLLDVLAAAADEITRELAPGSVDLRIRAGAPEFVVTPSPADRAPGGRVGAAFPDADPPPGTSSPVSPGSGEGPVARINLRLPEALKAQVERAADREGLSVNAWLVRIVAAAAGRAESGGREERRTPRGGQRYTGWAR